MYDAVHHSPSAIPCRFITHWLRLLGHGRPYRETGSRPAVLAMPDKATYAPQRNFTPALKREVSDPR
jgi:hypothetical protein